MFTKPYRPERQHSFWLKRDLNTAPQPFVKSLKSHYSRFDISLIPVLYNATSVSFKYADSHDYLVRDTGYASLIMTSLLDVKINGGFMTKIDSVINKLSRIETFMGVEDGDRGLFDNLKNRTSYNRSIIIGLSNDSDCIDDIEYIEICYDSNPNVIVSNRPLEKKFPVKTKRTGVSIRLEDFDFENTKRTRTGVKLRLYIKPEKASYTICTERFNCIDAANLSKHEDVSLRKSSDYILDSTEHHLNFYYTDVEGALLQFLDFNRERLSPKFGYSVNSVDKDTLKLIEMALF
jgi:hypothetical protein